MPCVFNAEASLSVGFLVVYKVVFFFSPGTYCGPTSAYYSFYDTNTVYYVAFQLLAESFAVIAVAILCSLSHFDSDMESLTLHCIAIGCFVFTWTVNIICMTT